jgi:hypothetical protein
MRGIFFSVIGGLSIFSAISAIIHGSFRSGRSPRVVITPESDPISFWLYVIFMFAVGCFALWRGIAEIRSMLRQRAERLQTSRNEKSRNA